MVKQISLEECCEVFNNQFSAIVVEEKKLEFMALTQEVCNRVLLD